MKIVLRIVGALVAVVVLAMLGGLFLPSTAHVERSVEINAPAEAVFPYVLDFKEFNTWSPWFKRDPNMDLTFEGPATGVGAKMSWASENQNVGSSSQETTEVVPNSLVRSRLDFGGQGVADAFFKLTPSDTGCVVTWGFDTQLGGNPIGRYFGLMFDTWIGADYEEGLAALKTIVETPSAPTTP